MLTRAALFAVALVAAGCGSQEVAGPKPEPIERYLVYEKVVAEKGIWIAEVDGSRPRLLVPGGHAPAISPDGKWVAYHSECRRSEFGCTYIASTSDGKPRLLSTRRLDEQVTWSPSSDRIGSISAFSGHLYQQGDEPDELVSIDVAGGEAVTLGQAQEFAGWSFSPDGKKVVFSGDAGLSVVAADGGEPEAITTEGDSDPVWGPDAIAFARSLPNSDRSGIWRIEPDGSGLRPITERLPPGFGGLTPVDWSADGKALLAGGGRVRGGWGTDPVIVDPETGAARDLGEYGRLWGASTVEVSRDGVWVLIQKGLFAHLEPEEREVVIASDAGGKTSVVIRGATFPSWNR